MNAAPEWDEDLWRQLKQQLTPEYDWTEFIDAYGAERVRLALVGFLNDLNDQMSARRDEVEALARELRGGQIGRAAYMERREKYTAWRRRVLHLKRLVDHRVIQMKALVRAANDLQQDQRNPAMFKAVQSLAWAIAEHQRACSVDGVQPSAADLRLWGVLDRVSIHHGAGELTLAVLIDTAWAAHEPGDSA